MAYSQERSLLPDQTPDTLTEVPQQDPELRAVITDHAAFTTSGHVASVWLGVITMLVITKKAPFSAGGTT